MDNCRKYCNIRHKICSNRGSRSSHVCSDREKEVARIKRLGYSNIN
nr:MAG TPA: hypothetical protein [Caudoviricetes sp.]